MEENHILSYIEKFLQTSTEKQQRQIGGLICLLDGTADSGSMHDVLETCIAASSIEYLKQCLETIGWYGKMKSEEANPDRLSPKIHLGHHIGPTPTNEELGI
jgi:hypothetical protein